MVIYIAVNNRKQLADGFLVCACPGCLAVAEILFLLIEQIVLVSSFLKMVCHCRHVVFGEHFYSVVHTHHKHILAIFIKRWPVNISATGAVSFPFRHLIIGIYYG